MISLNIYKLIALFRFILFYILFKKSSYKNFKYSNVYFQGYKKIRLGSKNIFQRHSSIIVDHFSNNQN